MTRSLPRAVYERFISRDRVYCVYRSPDDESQRFESVHYAEGVQWYDAGNLPTAMICRGYWDHFGRLRSWHLFHRLRQGQAMLVVKVLHGELVGFGWILRGGHFRREFWWLGEDVICLGPFWTHADHRGRGIYGQLLTAARHLSAARGWLPSYIWAQSDNWASIRGIEKAGFVPLGTHRVILRWLGLYRRHEAMC